MNNLTASTLASALLLSMTSPMLCASTSGGYAGLGLGVSSMNDFNDALILDRGGFAGRIFGGYRFNHYLGLEVDYAKLSNENFYLYDFPAINLEYKLSALSFLGKLYLPLNEQFNLNLGVGVAQMYADIDASTYFSNSHYLESTKTLVLTAKAGAEFRFSEHFATQVDFIGYDGHKGDYSHIPVPSSQLITVGFSYLF